MSKPTLSLAEVKAEVEAILKMGAENTDPEDAHVREDDLAANILAAVIAGHPDVKAMAIEFFRIAEGGRTRWYA